MFAKEVFSRPPSKGMGLNAWDDAVKAVGVPLHAFHACLRTSNTQAVIDRSRQEALAQGIDGARRPGLWIIKPANGSD